MASSKRYQLNTTDGISILKVLGFIAVSAVIAGAIDLLSQINFGDYGWLVPIINLILVTIQKFVKENN